MLNKPSLKAGISSSSLLFPANRDSLASRYGFFFKEELKLVGLFSLFLGLLFPQEKVLACT